MAIKLGVSVCVYLVQVKVNQYVAIIQQQVLYECGRETFSGVPAISWASELLVFVMTTDRQRRPSSVGRAAIDSRPPECRTLRRDRFHHQLFVGLPSLIQRLQQGAFN